MSKPREFKLSDVITTKKPNDCPDCKTRVETYIKNVDEWNEALNALQKENEELKKQFETIDKLKVHAEKLVEKIENEIKILTNAELKGSAFALKQAIDKYREAFLESEAENDE